MSNFKQTGDILREKKRALKAQAERRKNHLDLGGVGRMSTAKGSRAVLNVSKGYVRKMGGKSAKGG